MEYHHDVADTKDPLPANSSKLYMNSKFVGKYSPDESESFELINETSENVVSITKPKAYYDFSQTVSRYPASSIAHHNIAERNNYSSSFVNTSMPDVNSQSVDNPSDSEESFELINRTPEKVLYAKGTQEFYSPQNVSSDSISNLESVHNTAVKKLCSSYVEVCKNDDKPQQESKILALIAERKKVLASKNTPDDSERMCADGFIMEGLTKGIKNCDIAEKEFIAANKSHNNQFKANISMYEERSDPEGENLFHVAEKRHVSTLANVCKYDEEICSDTMKKVINRIKSCSIVDKQFSSNIACEEKCSDAIKINPTVNKHDLVLQKNNLTSMNASVEKYELKYSKTCMVAKSRKRCVDELFCLPYDDRFGEKEVVRAEQFPSCRPLNIVVRPEIPEAISILRSDCLCYLKKPRQTIDDNKGFRSEFSAYCSEQGNRIAQESKMRDLAKKLKDKMRKNPMKNSALKWAIERKNILSWHGFNFDF